MQRVLFSHLHLNEAIVLTADGVGEWATTTVAIGKRYNLEIKKEIHFPHSLGFLIFCIYLLYWL